MVGLPSARSARNLPPADAPAWEPRVPPLLTLRPRTLATDDRGPADPHRRPSLGRFAGRLQSGLLGCYPNSRYALKQEGSSGGIGTAAERRESNRRLRHHRRLPHRGPCLQGRFDRLVMFSALLGAERVRSSPRSRTRGPVQHSTSRPVPQHPAISRPDGGPRNRL
jgi:hypothetical protein